MRPACARAATCVIAGLTLVLSIAGLGASPVGGVAGAAAAAAATAAGAAATAAGATAAAATAPPSLSTIVIPNLGPGYTVSSEGPLNPSQFASDSPDPSAASAALSTLANTISTYERAWLANAGLNQVQDLVVRFPSTTGAQVFLQAAQHSLESGEIVTKGPLPSIPGARLVTYFAATNESGVGEAITMRAGIYVALLSFFSAEAGNTQPISPADAERVALAQHSALVSAPGGKDASSPSATPASSKKSVSSSDIGWAILAVAIVAVAVATPLILRRRRQRLEGFGLGDAAEPPEPATPL